MKYGDADYTAARNAVSAILKGWAQWAGPALTGR